MNEISFDSRPFYTTLQVDKVENKLQHLSSPFVDDPVDTCSTAAMSWRSKQQQKKSIKITRKAEVIAGWCRLKSI